MALGSTQPIAEMSTRVISWGGGVKGGRCLRLKTLSLSCAWELDQACTGIAIVVLICQDVEVCFSFSMEGKRWRFQNVERYRFPCLRYKSCRGIDKWLRSFLSSTPDGVEWSTTSPGCFINRKMTPQCPWNWWLGRCQSRSGCFGCFVCCVIVQYQIQ